MVREGGVLLYVCYSTVHVRRTEQKKKISKKDRFEVSSDLCIHMSNLISKFAVWIFRLTNFEIQKIGYKKNYCLCEKTRT